MQKWEPNLLTKLKRVKLLTPRPTRDGENHNGSLFEMNYVRRKCKIIMAACLK